MPEDITHASPDMAVTVTNDHPPPLIPEALTIIKIPRSRFSELIEPLSFESDSATDDKGTSSLPPGESDSDDNGPTTCFLLIANKWQIILSFAGISLLISTITISPLKHHLILGHHLWKFAATILSIFCGYLISDCIVGFIFLAVPNRWYLIYRMRKAACTYFWIASIIFTWSFCFDHTVSHMDVRKVVSYIYRVLPAVLLAFGLWQAQIIAFETFRGAFYIRRFYKRLKGAAIDLYMLDALMDCELGEHKQKVASPTKCIKKKVDEMMAVALNTRRMPRHVTGRLLLKSIEGFKKSGFKADDQSKILKAAREAFKRMDENGYIKKEDMEKFLAKKEVDIAFTLMEDAHDVGKISETSFLEWMVESYQQRKSLVHAIIDTEIIVWNLNVLASISMAMIIFIITLLIAEVTTPKILVAYFSQVLLLGFMFQNTAKTIFECIVFVFVRHPFEVGDCCIIDGVKMIVEEINIMTTVFLQFDHKKIYHPNSELSKKPISNCSRSPEMGERIEISIGISTPENSVTKLRERIKQYLETKPEHWQPKHSLLMTGIEDSKMKIDLYILHRKNYRNFHEMSKRKSELLFELNTIFQNLGIENYGIPKEIISVKNEKDDIPEETTPLLPKHV